MAGLARVQEAVAVLKMSSVMQVLMAEMGGSWDRPSSVLVVQEAGTTGLGLSLLMMVLSLPFL
jgi:hypothetical protein